MPLRRQTEQDLRALGIESPGSHDDAAEPLDLRTISREQWEDYLSYPLVLPAAIAQYMAGLTGEPTVLEKDHLEDAVNAFHEITLPYTAVYAAGQLRLMRE